MATRAALFLAAALHLAFAIFEIVSIDDKTSSPILLNVVVKKLTAPENPQPKHIEFSSDARDLTNTVVRNAGIYNVIMFAGFVWGLWPHCLGHRLTPDAVYALRSFFFSAAILAGVFGAVTLSPVCWVQAAFGLCGLIALRIDKSKESAIG